MFQADILRSFTGQQNADMLLALGAGKSVHGLGLAYYWRRTLRIGDFTAAAALNQTINFAADQSALAKRRAGQSPDFPGHDPSKLGFTEVDFLRGAYIRTITDFSGGGATAVTASFGDVVDPDELVTDQSVFTGVGETIIRTPAAAAYDIHRERTNTTSAVYFPVVRLVSDVFINVLTAGELEVVIPFRMVPRDTAAG